MNGRVRTKPVTRHLSGRSIWDVPLLFYSQPWLYIPLKPIGGWFLELTCSHSTLIIATAAGAKVRARSDDDSAELVNNYELYLSFKHSNRAVFTLINDDLQVAVIVNSCLPGSVEH
jgi:hypothetical protein